MENFPASRLALILLGGILFSLPFDRIPSMSFGDQSITVRISQVLGLLLITVSIPTLFSRMRELVRSPWIWLVAFNLAASISAAVSINPKRSFFVALFTLFVSVLAWTISQYVRPENIQRLGKYLFGGAIVACLFALYQYFGDLMGLPYWTTGLREQYTREVFGFPRVQAASLEPLYFANLLLIPLAIAGSLAVFRNRKYYWLFFVFLTFITLTLSRGAYAAGLVIILGLLVAAIRFRGGNAGLKLLGAVVASIAAAFALIVLGGGLDDRKDTTSTSNADAFGKQATNINRGESSEGRAVTRRMSWQAFTERPLLGIGPGNFGNYAHAQNPKKFPSTNTIANNEPLEILGETGALGFLTFLAFCLSLLWRAFNYLARRSSLQRPWVLGLLLALIGMAIQYQTFSTLYITHVWVTIGLLAGLVGSWLSGQGRIEA